LYFVVFTILILLFLNHIFDGWLQLCYSLKRITSPTRGSEFHQRMLKVVTNLVIGWMISWLLIMISQTTHPADAFSLSYFVRPCNCMRSTNFPRTGLLMIYLPENVNMKWSYRFLSTRVARIVKMVIADHGYCYRRTDI